MEQWWNDADGGKPKFSEKKNLLQYHSVHHKYHMDSQKIFKGVS
jgi:hypothetical protein